jgi:hypothetical protein
MARIRTIKPEFPQSESMGNVSRDARLCFIMLWTIADDSGRLRGNSRMLASLLFPYDDDAPALMGGWLEELEREGCISRYSVDGASYVEIAKWLSHQKIDKPSPSKLPAFDGQSRILANHRESSSLDQDQGPSTKDQGSPSLRSGEAASASPTSPAKPAKPKVRKSADGRITLATYLTNCKAAGVKPVPDGHAVRQWADDAGITAEMLQIAWVKFRERYTEGEKGKGKLYTRWADHFATAVKDNWFKVWFLGENGMQWTTAGLTCKAVLDAKHKQQEVANAD